jgi:hypothetical protein
MFNTYNVNAGQIIPFPEIVGNIMNIIIFGIIIALFLQLLNIIFKRYGKNKSASFFQLLSTIFLILVILIFYILISTMAKIGVGSFIGEGNIELGIIGEETIEIVHGSWGPSFGFIFIIIISIISIIILANDFKRFILKRKREK